MSKTLTERRDALRAALEPLAVAADHGTDLVGGLSLAISAKRQADALERIADFFEGARIYPEDTGHALHVITQARS